MAGDFVGIIAAIFSGLGALLILLFAVVKFIHDGRMRMVDESQKLFDEHFSLVEKLSADPATPPDLYALIVSASHRAVNEESFGRGAAERFLSGKVDSETPSSPAAQEVYAKLEQLEQHRPDLAKAFKMAATSAVFASAFRHIAREMSPLRAYREARATRSAQRADRAEFVPDAIATIEPVCVPAAA